MKKTITILMLCLMFGCVTSFSAYAEDTADTELLQRIQKLEESQKLFILSGGWLDRITISGVLEAEAGFASTDFADPNEEDTNESSVALATMELGVDAEISDNISGHVLFLWEEEDPVNLDEGVITISGEDTPLFLSAGKMYVPFGNFESTMISDPLTLELGETGESAIQVGFESEGFYGSAYVFNGDIDEAGDDSHIDNFGANAGFSIENDGFCLDAGVSYINNMLDSDGLGEWAEETMDTDGTGLKDYVGGFGAHVTVNTGPVTLIGEYITMIDDPEFVSDAGVTAKGEKIAAYNAEVAFAFDLAGKEAAIGLAYQGTSDSGDFLPETRIVGAIGVGIFDSTTLALEYAHDEFENDDKADVITAQLAIEF
ncbi:MAG: LbtU family siderophore porin [Desulfobacteraceae bacterium]|nr:LbtU family siderophore porin [Desulfobacteraceae bacterium]MBC2755431.1 LbtU family siderophore porin [Desulfobacteraceae bacterium]